MDARNLALPMSSQKGDSIAFTQNLAKASINCPANQADITKICFV
jgi:hypothetical protein